MSAKSWWAMLAVLVVVSGCSGARSAHRAGPPATGFVSAPFGGDLHTLSVWSWSGRRLYTVHTKALAEGGSVGPISPDGSRFVVSGNSTDSQMFDIRGGSVVAHGATIVGAWADDSRHLCDIQNTNNSASGFGPARLVLVDPGHGQRVVASNVGSYGSHAGPALLRCSIADDQALVAENFMGENMSVTAVSLSTGRTSTPKWAPVSRSAEVVAISGNGRYVLEDHLQPTPASWVINTATGAVVSRSGGQPVAISWNGDVIATATGVTGALDVFNWRTGVDLWQPRPRSVNGVTSGTLSDIAARPDSDDFAISVDNPHGLAGQGSAALWLISAAGPPKLLDKNVLPDVI